MLKVIGAGLSRTGTTPLHLALRALGLRSIHYDQVRLNDVISGALIGAAIGHIVAQNHNQKVFGMDVVPYADYRGGFGLALEKRW